MKTVTLITCNDAAQAHIIQGALENEGIESILENVNMSGLYPHCGNGLSGVGILVADTDYEKAVCLLRQNHDIAEEMNCCPHCGSTDIKLILKKEHRLRAICAAVASMLAGSTPGNNHWDYICEVCGQKFEQPVAEAGNKK